MHSCRSRAAGMFMAGVASVAIVVLASATTRTPTPARLRYPAVNAISAGVQRNAALADGTVS
jgi:hypothetical protein